VALERRPICRDVVSDELTENRPASRFLSKRRSLVRIIVTVARAASAADRLKERDIGLEGGEFGKHPRVSRGTAGRLNSRVISRRR
jgi:hypothetical protein